MDASPEHTDAFPERTVALPEHTDAFERTDAPPDKRRDITRGAGKAKGLGQGGTAEPSSAEPGIHYLRTLGCRQQGNKYNVNT